MSFNWLLYLDVADELMHLRKIGLEEACWRSATSRAYYAVFCKIREILEGRGHDFSAQTIIGMGYKGVHDAVIKILKSMNTSLQRKTGANLDRLRRERNRADYVGAITFTEGRSWKAYQTAKNIESDLPSL